MDTFLRYRVVFKYIGGVLLIISWGYLLSSVVSLLTAEPYAPHFLLMGTLAALSGWYMRRGVPEKNVERAEVGAIAALSFLVVSLLSIQPFSYIAGLSLLDGWFEAMSAVTTTGFSLLDAESAPKTILFFRSLLQWLGGLGFMALTVTLLMISGRPAVAMLKEDVSGVRLAPRIGTHMRIILFTYLFFTVASAVALWVAGLDLFKSLCYALSGISTGGFSPEGPTPHGLNPRAVSVVMLFVMLLGAVNFITYYRVWQESSEGVAPRQMLRENPQPLFLLAMVAVVFGISLFSLPEGWSPYEMLFTVVSAQTTTGFYISPPATLPPHLTSLIVVSMFIGGCVGSTAGGIKVYRAVEALRLIHRTITLRLYSRDKVVGHPRRLAIEREEEPLVLFSIISIYVIVIALATLYLVWQGYEPLAGLFDVVSAVSTVGLTAGVVSPQMGWDVKLVFIGLMWAGRLEFIPLILWLYATVMRRE